MDVLLHELHADDFIRFGTTVTMQQGIVLLVDRSVLHSGLSFIWIIGGQHVDVHVVGVVGGLRRVVRRWNCALQVIYVHVVGMRSGGCGCVVRSHVHVVVSGYLKEILALVYHH